MADRRDPDPRALLERYRELCEAMGMARFSGVALSAEGASELERLEMALLSLLSGRAANGRTPTDSPAPVSPRPQPTPSTEPRLPSDAVTVAEVFCDGACQGNPGPGGFGVLVRAPGHAEIEESGGSLRTTNNQMELTGAIVGLKVAASLGARQVVVRSDSEYLVKGMNGWLAGWERKGWKTASGAPVKNRELWEELSCLVKARSVTWTWVRGHAGHVENERCDALAVAAAREAAGRR